MNNEHQSKSQRLVEVGVLGSCFVGCAFSTAVFILVCCWAIKVLWKATFG